MKFGKSLKNQIEKTVPEWRDKFLSYKLLKKHLKLIAAAAADSGDRPLKRPRVAEGDGDGDAFIRLLEVELKKLNAFFIEKEEEYIIRQERLQYLIATAKDPVQEMISMRKEIVDFHGEMVLLENYSVLNYIGLVKILKKHDKRTGALIRLPFIQKISQQPFFTTDLVYKFVKECEAMLEHLFPNIELPISGDDVNENGDEDGDEEQKPPESASSLLSGGIPNLEEIEYIESFYMKATISAVRVLQEIRGGSSTVSAFSLPPM